jgi:ribosomal protein S18 acetylase RimI-like enzyme
MSDITSVAIRPAIPADAAAIGRIYVETWRTTYAGMVPDRVLLGMSEARQRMRWAQWFQRPGSEFALVAQDRDAGLVGFVSCGAARGRPLASSGINGAGEVFTLYVLPDFQGQGVGRRLLAGAFQGLADRRFGAAVIWVLAANPARFFYEALGGRRIAEQQERLWGTKLPEYAYLWPDLGAALAANLRIKKPH